jgi:hypothetical protein
MFSFAQASGGSSRRRFPREREAPMRLALVAKTLSFLLPAFRCRGSSLRKLKDFAPPSGDAVIANCLPSSPRCSGLHSVNSRSLRDANHPFARNPSPETQVPVIPPDAATPRETVLPPRTLPAQTPEFACFGG